MKKTLTILVALSILAVCLISFKSHQSNKKEIFIKLQEKRIENAKKVIIKLTEEKEKKSREAQINIKDPEHCKEFLADLNITHKESIDFWHKKIDDAKQKIIEQN